MGPVEEMERPTHTTVLTRHMDKNLRRRDEDANPPRSPKSEHSSYYFEQATYIRRQNTKKDGRDMQAKKKRNI